MLGGKARIQSPTRKVGIPPEHPHHPDCVLSTVHPDHQLPTPERNASATRTQGAERRAHAARLRRGWRRHTAGARRGGRTTRTGHDCTTSHTTRVRHSHDCIATRQRNCSQLEAFLPPCARSAPRVQAAAPCAQVEAEFYPERQPFWPFGDPLKEHPEQLQQRERLRVREARARAEEWMRRNPTVGPQLRSF